MGRPRKDNSKPQPRDNKQKYRRQVNADWLTEHDGKLVAPDVLREAMSRLFDATSGITVRLNESDIPTCLTILNDTIVPYKLSGKRLMLYAYQYPKRNTDWVDNIEELEDELTE